MVELTEEQIALVEKLRSFDKNLTIRWSEEGIVSLIDGFIAIPLEDVEGSVRDFLMEYSPLFGFKSDLSDLKLITKVEGYNTFHIKYQQYHKGIPVLNTFTSVHLSKESKIVNITNNYHPVIPLDTESILSSGISKESAIELIHSSLNAETRLARDTSANLVIYPMSGKFYLAWEISVALKNPPEGHRVYVDIRNGSTIKKVDVFRRFTTGKGRVFIPNPVVALKNPNLTPESDIPEDAYTTVVLKGLDGSGFLRGEYVDTFYTPNRVYEPSHLFYYKRGDSRYCEVMAYYHIDSCQRFIQELGFKNVCNKQIKVNACAEGEDSYFDYGSKTITFGTIGIPDAEDADIIIHEYGHAILDDQVPFLSLTEEGCAMEQGFGDFLAACFFAEESDGFNREAVGDWNGIGMIQHCVRRVDNQKYYPEDFRGVMTCDADGEIWSAALWDLYLVLGGSSKEKDNRLKARERSIRLVLEGNFYLTPLSTFIDGAEAIIAANKQLYKGKDDEKIRDIFIKRGFF